MALVYVQLIAGIYKNDVDIVLSVMIGFSERK